jgi:LysM repeat protein
VARPATEGDVAAPELDEGPVDTEAAADERPSDSPDLDEPADDLPPRGRMHRDWAAPPPWVNPAAGAEPGPGDPHGAGLATSRWLADVKPGDDAGDDEDALTAEGAAPRARAVGAAGTAGPGDPDFMGLAEATPRPELAGIVGRPRRPVRPTQDRSRRERLVVGQARPAGRPERGRDRDDPTPSWERPRRFEAYPSLRGRVSMPSVPRVALGAVALLVAAVLLFTLPAMFLTKSSPTVVGSPTPSPVPSVSVAPTASPAPTALTYTVKPGDTLIKIANHFKVTQQALLAANPKLKNANVITIGQVLVIPTPPPPDVVKSSAGPSASPSGSTAP